MMQLNDYQEKVLKDLSTYLDLLNDNAGKLHSTFGMFWKNQGILNQSYQDHVKGVPHICIKVPTAGGKTFIAVNALDRIFERFVHYQPLTPKFVVWLVPSLTILEQTVKHLSNPEHPYRQQLNLQFQGRVQIYQKADVLQGSGFDADTVKGQLSILIMSFDSLKGKSKEVLKSYQENGYLASFNDLLTEDEQLADIDKTALVNVIRGLKPVVIVDESHNATSQLSVDMLSNLNPIFILDLTATPRQNSNIISYVDAMALKKKNMVKLPVIVANQQDNVEVINNALKMREQLEVFAKREEQEGGKYIRPIILFQAEPKNKEDTQTFEKIKQTLIHDMKIDPAEIKIKTANINELKGIDLMDKTCSVRYIITVNALKEGWDCPFAYILATLANRSSEIDVTQILGRVLRMPHVTKHKYDYLNMSYVFTASNKFTETLEMVVKGLNQAGFSNRDYRAQDLTEILTPSTSSAPTQLPLTLAPESSEAITFDSNKLDMNWRVNAQAGLTVALANLSVDHPNHASKTQDALAHIKMIAQEENTRYELQARESTSIGLPPELIEHSTMKKMLQQWVNSTRSLKIPQFFISVPAQGLFDSGDSWQLLERSELLEDFKLSIQDIKINFDAVHADIQVIDLKSIDDQDGNVKADYGSMKQKDKEKFLTLINQQPETGKMTTLIGRLLTLIGKNSFYPIADQDVKAYIKRILENMTSQQRQDCMHNDFHYVRHIKQKITTLASHYAETAFHNKLTSGQITCQPNFLLPGHITPSELGNSLAKSLYAQEASMNTLEDMVIQAIVGHCENVIWWHRNLEKGVGFVLNGFINHYPDFIIMTENNTLILIETKGDQLANTDSEQKLRLGKEWQAQANQLSRDTGVKYRYMMVFKDTPLNGAFSLADAVGSIKKL